MRERHPVMAYVTNPYAPKARRDIVNQVKRKEINISQAAKKYGVCRSTIYKWLKRAPKDYKVFIETKSSRPLTHPNQLSEKVVSRVIEIRKETNRCAPVIHAQMVKEGFQLSKTSVENILKRNKLLRRPKPAKLKTKIDRPNPVTFPGELVQMDTIHLVRTDNSRYYIYTVIDVYSRLTFAYYSPEFKQAISLKVLKMAQEYFGFKFELVQTDNGHEFGQSFLFGLHQLNINLRHSRVRKPNDNAHIERFNRTIQEECFYNLPPKETGLNQRLFKWIDYYNNHRLHLSLNLQTPREFVAKVLG